jgi:ankyrin repeat protein
VLSRRQKLWGVIAAGVLCTLNYAALSGAGYLTFTQFTQNYDPYETDEHFYSATVLKRKGWTELHLAAARGNRDEVQALLDRGHVVELRNDKGRTPLYEAAKRGRTPAVRLLIERGADVEARGGGGYTPLISAAKHGHLEVARLLVAKGADVNAKCDCGATPLYQAVVEEDLEMTRFLLEAGASVNLRIRGKTVLDVAEQFEHSEIADLLRQYGGKTLKQYNEHFKRGLDRLRKKDYAGAIAEYDRALHLEPSSAEAYYNRGVAWRDSGQFDRAIPDFRQTVELNPQHDGAYDNLGWIFAQQGQYEEAIRNWTKVIELKPDEPGAYYNRAIALHRQGEAAGSWDDTKRACELGHQEACGALSTIFRGRRPA